MDCEYCARGLSFGVHQCDRCGWRVPLAVVCAWCALVLKGGRTPISHGICGPCSDAHFAERCLDQR